MPDIIYFIDDGGVIHWKIVNTEDEYSVEETQEWAEVASKYDWPIHTFIQGVDEGMLENLSEELFNEYHQTDNDFKDYLLRRFDYDMDAFLNFLIDNFTHEDIKDLRDGLSKSLKYS